MASSKTKEKDKKMQDKYQAVLSRLLREEDNKYCIDCDAKGRKSFHSLSCHYLYSFLAYCHRKNRSMLAWAGHQNIFHTPIEVVKHGVNGYIWLPDRRPASVQTYC